MSGFVLQDYKRRFCSFRCRPGTPPTPRGTQRRATCCPTKCWEHRDIVRDLLDEAFSVEVDETLERLTLETLSHERFVGQVVRDDERVVYSSIKKATRSFHRPPPCAPVAAIVKTPQGR